MFAASVVVSWLGALDRLPGPVQLQERPVGIAAWLPVAPLVQPPAFVAGTLLVLGLLAWLVRAARPTVPAALLFALFFLYARIEDVNALPGGDQVGHGKFLVGNALLCLALGGVVGRRDPDGGVRRGMDYAFGVAAALYLWAGLVKVLVSGPFWAWKAGLSMLAYERSFHVTGALEAARVWAGTHPWVGVLGGNAVIFVEVASIVLVVPRWRSWFAVWTAAMHLGIGVFTGYFYPDWILGLWGMAIWSDRLHGIDPWRRQMPRTAWTASLDSPST
jgi:hypothetical protein